MQCTYRVNKIISHVFSVLVSARSELEGSIRCAAKPCTDMMQTSQLQMPRNQQQLAFGTAVSQTNTKRQTKTWSHCLQSVFLYIFYGY